MLPPAVACYLPRASETHPADVCGSSSLISTAVKFHSLNTPHCIQFPVEGHLGHFQVFFFVCFIFSFAITNNAAKKILARALVQA